MLFYFKSPKIYCLLLLQDRQIFVEEIFIILVGLKNIIVALLLPSQQIFVKVNYYEGLYLPS